MRLRVKISSLFAEEPLAPMIATLALLTPIFRFTWDLLPQTIVHIVILVIVVTHILRYRISWRVSFHGLLALFFLASLASVVQAPDKAIGLNDLLILTDGLLLAYLVAYVPVELKRKLLGVPVFVGFWFAVLLIIISIKNGGAGLAGAGILPVELSVNASVVAGYLTLCLPLTFTLDKGRRNERLLLAMALLGGIVLTGSRAAIGAGAASFIICSRNESRMRWRWLVVAVAGALSVLAALTWLKAGPGQGNSLVDRISWYHAAFDMFAAHPLTGAGWGNFGRLLQTFRPAPGLNTLYAHNILLQIIAETGIAGLVIFILLLAAFFRAAHGANAAGDGRVTIARPVIVAVIAFLAVNMVDYSFYIPGVMFLFWLCIGSIVTLQAGRRRERVSVVNRVSAVVVVLAGIWILALPYRAHLHLQRGVSDLQRGRFDEAINELHAAIRIDPLPHETYRRLAEVYYKKYALTGNRRMLERAITNEATAVRVCRVDAQSWADLGVLYWSAGERDKAVESTLQALLYDRYNPTYAAHLRQFEHH
jgi:O-antigen ligase